MHSNNNLFHNFFVYKVLPSTAALNLHVDHRRVPSSYHTIHLTSELTKCFSVQPTTIPSTIPYSPSHLTPRFFAPLLSHSSLKKTLPPQSNLLDPTVTRLQPLLSLLAQTTVACYASPILSRDHIV
eukprot:GFKZ01008930.1.p1 GENE.GFKZ01008930.1~~GFKZ01008930.1.p1  ORF type:complete len:126 (-),score=7.74 GFKZ01008930.1:114-491(-)